MKNCLIEIRCQQMTHYCITDTETLQYRLRMPRVFTRPTTHPATGSHWPKNANLIFTYIVFKKMLKQSEGGSFYQELL